jgi:hypothetical protein
VERGGLDRAAAEQDLRAAVAARARSLPAAAAAPSPPPPARARLLPAEKWLLALLLKQAEGIEEALGEMEDGDLEGLGAAGVLRAAKALYLRGERATHAALEEAVASVEDRRMLTEVAVEDPPVGAAKPLACVHELRRRTLERRLAKIQTDLAGATGEDLEALLQQKLNLRRQMASL